ncbi:MAG: DUF3048 domain-containing protein [Candidatus Komeilibacteria bacterium]
MLALYLWRHQTASLVMVEPLPKNFGSTENISGQWISIMLDNTPEARPQLGLSSAQFVYEALVEGGMTRLMAVYNRDNLPSKVGPIRSARPYFLDLANSWGGWYWHAGGSPQALNQLAKQVWHFTNIDEIGYQGIYFYRDNEYVSPHNLFSDRQHIHLALDKFSANSLPLSGWRWQAELELRWRPNNASSLLIPYPLQSTTVVWTYDRFTNNWQRQVGGRVEDIDVKNVVVLFMETSMIDKERLAIDTIGKGSAWLLADGQKQELTWRRASHNDVLSLWQGDHLVALRPGLVWFNIIPSYLQPEWLP